MLLNPRVYSAMFRRSVTSPGQQTAQPLNDLATLRQFLAGNGLFAFFDAPWVPIYLGILFLFDVWFGVFASVAALILLALAVANEKATKSLLAEAGSEHIQAQDLATSNLRNAEVLHAMGMLPGIMGRWAARHEAFLIKQSQASDRAGTLSNLSKILRLLFQSLILGLGAWLVVKGSLTPGMMIAGSIVMGRALAPIDQMISSWKGFVGARNAYQRIEELLAQQPEASQYMSLPAPRGDISVEAVVAVPPGGNLSTLRGVNFSVAAGEHVGIVGPSAAGKSTLARVLLGVWPVQAGKVRLDGADIGHLENEESVGNRKGPRDLAWLHGERLLRERLMGGHRLAPAVIAHVRMTQEDPVVLGMRHRQCLEISPRLELCHQGGNLVGIPDHEQQKAHAPAVGSGGEERLQFRCGCLPAHDPLASVEFGEGQLSGLLLNQLALQA